MIPGASGSATAPLLRADHLGASTFVEKGWHLIAREEFAAAEAVLLQALQFAPADTGALTLLGWSRMRQGRSDEAQAVFTSLLQRDPTLAMARAGLGYLFLIRHRPHEALEHLTGAIRQLRDPRASLYAHFFLGVFFGSRELHSEAIRWLRKATALAPNFTEAYYELGREYLKEGRREQALDTWRRGQAGNPATAWGERCGSAIVLAGRGETPPSYS